MLSILTIAMYLLYTDISSLHKQLLLSSPVKTVEKYRVYEILGFIYQKTCLIVKMLFKGNLRLDTVMAKTFLPDKKTCDTYEHQPTIALSF